MRQALFERNAVLGLELNVKVLSSRMCAKYNACIFVQECHGHDHDLASWGTKHPKQRWVGSSWPSRAAGGTIIGLERSFVQIADSMMQAMISHVHAMVIQFDTVCGLILIINVHYTQI